MSAKLVGSSICKPALTCAGHLTMPGILTPPSGPPVHYYFDIIFYCLNLSGLGSRSLDLGQSF